MIKKSKDILGNIKITHQIEPRSRNQSAYLESMHKNTFTFGIGLAGTGKSLLGIWQAILELLNPNNRIRRIIVIRPVIQNRLGENIGSLPGGITEKMFPFAGSIIDNLLTFITKDAINELILKEYIEVIPLTLLRGRSLNNAFVIVEEAQNIKLAGKGVYMVMSRLGAHSKMVFNGDLAQSDLGYEDSALKDAIERLEDMKGVGIVQLYEKQDIQRHPLLYEVMRRFDETDGNPFES